MTDRFTERGFADFGHEEERRARRLAQIEGETWITVCSGPVKP